MKKIKSSILKRTKNLLAILLLISIGPVFCWGQATSIAGQPQNNIKFSFKTPGKIGLGYERMLSPKSSLYLGTTFIFFTKTEGVAFNDFDSGERIRSNKSLDRTSQGYELNLAYRYYLADAAKSLNGFYLEAHSFLGSHELSYKNRKAAIYNYGGGWLFSSAGLNGYKITFLGTKHVTVGGLGLNLGYQKRWKKISLDLGLGWTYNKAINNEKGMRVGSLKGYEDILILFDEHINGHVFNVTIGIGYSF